MNQSILKLHKGEGDRKNGWGKLKMVIDYRDAPHLKRKERNFGIIHSKNISFGLSSVL